MKNHFVLSTCGKRKNVWGLEKIMGEKQSCSYFLSYLLINPGEGPKLHKHKKQHETFFVLNGELLCQVKNNTVILQKGDALLIKKNTKHKYINATSAAVEILILFTSGKIEKLFKKLQKHNLSDQNSCAEQLNKISKKYGTIFYD